MDIPDMKTSFLFLKEKRPNLMCNLWIIINCQTASYRNKNNVYRIPPSVTIETDGMINQQTTLKTYKKKH